MEGERRRKESIDIFLFLFRDSEQPTLAAVLLLGRTFTTDDVVVTWETSSLETRERALRNLLKGASIDCRISTATNNDNKGGVGNEGGGEIIKVSDALARLLHAKEKGKAGHEPDRACLIRLLCYPGDVVGGRSIS
ncbi:hypothetical protein OUZ56_001679 [Daphnia magna]|uniref:Uncharacterized protein n=1 Tax=Daphnia magna TaxID=35525 RepID=A0ABR0A3E5_9CRUS|nr:hypothetical protein OUZ56_001679 [Daphnia magna]